MTEKDKEIQDLRRRVDELERALQVVVESEKFCRYCAYLDGDCSPWSDSCFPKARV